MSDWTGLAVVRQAAGELGLPLPSTLVTSTDQTAILLTALLNTSGNELSMFYPWQQLLKQWEFNTVNGDADYALPTDWGYALDQTQWDGTNRWPLAGPKTPQEWAWLKHGNVATFPRTRYRILDNELHIIPTPGATAIAISMEYVKNTWVYNSGAGTYASMVTLDAETVQYNPWMLVKYIKLKFFELKAFDTSAVRSDFMRVFNSLTGKDKGAPVLSLTGNRQPEFIGVWSIPDGNWNV
jgi:hypothetical protein